MVFVYLPLFYLKEKNPQKDKPGEGSAEEDSDNENNDRNLGDTTDILNMVIFSTNESIIQSFFMQGRMKQLNNNSGSSTELLARPKCNMWHQVLTYCYISVHLISPLSNAYIYFHFPSNVVK